MHTQQEKTTHVHPILFTAPMVRAILDGRKTQTRRIMKPQPEFLTGSGRRVYKDQDFKKSWESIRGTGEGFGYSDCPYGSPGDHLYVRETHFLFGKWARNGQTKTGKDKWKFVEWKSEANSRHSLGPLFEDNQPVDYLISRSKDNPGTNRWYKRNARFMPRAASRITLQITDIRAQRLHHITVADAIAEGIESQQIGNFNHYKDYIREKAISDPIASYRTLWQTINGPHSWDANPWVWAITFKKI